MKGVIINCLAEMVKEKFGEDKWEATLKGAGLDRSTVFFTTQDIPDDVALKVIESACQVLGISRAQAADAFGEYWVNTFAPKIYGAYYEGVNSAKDFLLNMDRVHRAATRSLPDAHPPRFGYDWQDDKTLIMTYQSHRGLIDIMIGLIKGVGKYYQEDLQVTQIGPNKVRIVFP